MGLFKRKKKKLEIPEKKIVRIEVPASYQIEVEPSTLNVETPEELVAEVDVEEEFPEELDKNIEIEASIYFICDVCGKELSSKRGLNIHKTRMHS